MTLATLTASEVLHRLPEFDSVIDCRSEAEFALDRLPGAINWPTLDNQQRDAIGTLYVQGSPFEARKRGAALAARNIAAHIEREVIDKPKDWRPLTYCWRGGQRSGALSLILSQIGFRVTLLEGGYKAFRAALLLDLPYAVNRLSWRVVCGTTGSGKTRLLQALAAQGAQVLDLEALAQHRSSVLGALPGQAQPSQKHYDTLIWQKLRQFDPARPIFIESESKKVGNLTVPPPLIEAMRASPCLSLILPDVERVALLMEDYAFFVHNTEPFCERLELLTSLLGKALVAEWQASVRSGIIEPVVLELLQRHYDPVYLRSMRSNFRQFAEARIIEPADHSGAAMAVLAEQLVKEMA